MIVFLKMAPLEPSTLLANFPDTGLCHFPTLGDCGITMEQMTAAVNGCKLELKESHGKIDG